MIFVMDHPESMLSKKKKKEDEEEEEGKGYSKIPSSI